ncbi:MAG: methyltransferase domain-containing protein [Verrucomicrobiae bacterium]|nr:methyltransferase domain-containing protein [Verrucomicrobiae bacterium]
MGRWQFAVWAMGARFKADAGRCPYCRSTRHLFLQRKKILLQARRCRDCGLVYRWPADDPERLRKWYNQGYDGGIVTDLPRAEELPGLLEKSFCGSRYEKADYLRWVSEAIPAPARVLDYGCSWGYFVWQLQRAGYAAEGFEISGVRTGFGREKLGLRLVSDWEANRPAIKESYDVVFSGHVLEHAAEVKKGLTQLTEAIRPGGFLVLVVPNGGGREARRWGVRWGPYLGETHTVAFEAEWFSNHLGEFGMKIGELFSPDRDGKDRKCEGDELVCVAQKGGDRDF